jgi:hypothetical protein
MSDIGARSDSRTRHGLVAQLPQLGPLIGWLRDHNGRARARLWAKADENYGGRAVLALTVTVGRHGPEMNSAQFWRILPVELTGTRPAAVQRFALADVDLPLPAEGAAVRMVMLHVEHREGTLPAAYGAARTVDNPLADGMAAELPEPLEVRYEEFAGDDPLKPKQQFIQELFTELEQELRSDRDTGAAPIPNTYSRLRRRDLPLPECRPPASSRTHSLPLTFAAGCCRHPGVEFDRELADRALAAVAAHADKHGDVAFVCMLGDQIYADATAGVLDVDERLEKYTTRYDAAFDSKGFRNLTSRLPVYMTADDHEIRDGWPNDVLPQSAEHVYWDRSVEWAWQLYFAHQRAHGPRRAQASVLAKPDPTSLWYGLEERGVPFFFFDARFDRVPAGTDIVGTAQIEAFADWLDRAAFADWLEDLAAAEARSRQLRYVPKFVVCGSVLAPGLKEFDSSPERARRADTWQAFLADRAEIARRIVARGLQNVVFLSGDYHCAAVASLRLQDAIQGYAIVAPPFYAPFPFANVRAEEVTATGYLRDRTHGAPLLGVYEAKALEVQGFALISVHRRVAEPLDPGDWEIEVRIYQDCWRDNGEPHARLAATALLARGKADWV